MPHDLSLQPFHKTDQAAPGLVLMHRRTADGGSRWLTFRDPVRVVEATETADVLPALQQVEEAVAQGLYAAGFIAYEAAPAFDPAFKVRGPVPLPLLWFGLYARCTETGALQERPFAAAPLLSSAEAASKAPAQSWTPSVSVGDYMAAMERIKAYIAAGDTYQVNYTFQLRQGSATESSLLPASVPGRHGAYLDTGPHVIHSASPELFFRVKGDTVTCRPMKGTAPRGRMLHEDAEQERALKHSAKNRAENVMIVDMVRNDLGRIAKPGSVRVDSLFDVEKYTTLFQMTSTVSARTTAPYHELFRALFPCSSITGAPKVRTMQIIAELERQPRGIYTGAIGYLAPGREAEFNVAIRTVHLNRHTGVATYGTGSGIVWDSAPEKEYDECRTKALVLTAGHPAFSLLETVKWTPREGFWLLEEHLDRLTSSAQYFDVPIDVNGVVSRLEAATAQSPEHPLRIRLLVDQQGIARTETFPLPEAEASRPQRVALARAPVDPNDPFLYHKTTSRALYEKAREAFPEHDDVVLWNPRGEVTESTVANIVVELDGEYLTPPVSSGLLPGTFRAHLLARDAIKERIITRGDLARCSRFYLINSVRGWMRGWGIG